MQDGLGTGVLRLSREREVRSGRPPGSNSTTRLAKDYKKLAETLAAFVVIASIRLEQTYRASYDLIELGSNCQLSGVGSMSGPGASFTERSAGTTGLA